MRIAIISDSFPPLKNSAAVLVYSLAEEMASAGHTIVVITPTKNIEKQFVEEDCGAFKVLRIRCGGIKSHHKFVRGLSELALIFSLPYRYNKTPYGQSQWEIVIWYSPTIFLSGLVKYLKIKTKLSYLILRDMVPDWMVDMGIMKKGFSYYLLKFFEHNQYQLADVIGVQSQGNKKYIQKLDLPNLKKLEFLPNWMPSISTKYSFRDDVHTCINLQNTILFGKKILIYAGNLGEAQGIQNLGQVIHNLKDQSDYGFLIIGRGSKKKWLHDFIVSNSLNNVLLLDEVDLMTLSMYYRQCVLGLIFLDPRHQSHNIPGKFISYLEAGLPVAAYVNPGNDLIRIIENEKLGIVSKSLDKFCKKLISFDDKIEAKNYSIRARSYYENNYQPNIIANKIIDFYSINKI